mmetsp:Transcript_4538/g.9676  ORF Transcript_4538/g.9676 Transcript_4538/m.9676 type:complete len:90 (-) Transcript_4538:70-339(-)
MNWFENVARIGIGHLNFDDTFFITSFTPLSDIQQLRIGALRFWYWRIVQENNGIRGWPLATRERALVNCSSSSIKQGTGALKKLQSACS